MASAVASFLLANGQAVSRTQPGLTRGDLECNGALSPPGGHYAGLQAWRQLDQMKHAGKVGQSHSFRQLTALCISQAPRTQQQTKRVQPLSSHT